MMENTKKIRTMIDSLLENTSEPNLVKSLSEIKGQLDGVDKDYDDLAKEHKELKLDYSNYIKKQPYKDEEEEETKEPESFEEFASRIVLEKGEEF